MINKNFRTEVKRIAYTKTEGFMHLPIYVDCTSRIGGKAEKIELNLEIHVNKDLPVDLVVGIDAINAYGIDILV